MPLSDAGKFVWRSGASSYIFVKDFSQMAPAIVDPFENFERADDGTLRVYSTATYKKTIDLEFEDIGATQRNQFATIWKNARTSLDFYDKQNNASKTGTFAWLGGFNFFYSDWGIYYKNLYNGRITLEEI